MTGEGAGPGQEKKKKKSHSRRGENERHCLSSTAALGRACAREGESQRASQRSGTGGGAGVNPQRFLPSRPPNPAINEDPLEAAGGPQKPAEPEREAQTSAPRCN